MKPLFILKIGGSVATRKDRPGISVRKGLLTQAARAIQNAAEQKKFRLILIHGAGAAGHQLAKKYDLKHGTLGDRAKEKAALRSQSANQRLNHAVVEAFVRAGLPAVSVHTASVVIQKNGRISRFDTSPVAAALRHGYLPVLYGEMVFDEKLGMTVCSGDTLAARLAQKFKASKIFFASDIDGIFTADPHRFPGAELIGKTSWKELARNARISGSHNVDVTGGLQGKIQSLAPLRRTGIRSIEIFNGLRPANFEKALVGRSFPHTVLNK